MADTTNNVVMILESKFPAYGGGGAESQVLTLGGRLVDRNIGVQVLVPRVAYGASQAKREIVERLDVRRIDYPRLRVFGGFVMLLKLAVFLFTHRNRYAVIHAHIAHNMAAVAAIMGKLLGKPVLIKLTGMHELVGGILDPNPGWPARLRKQAIRRATLIQATSRRIRQTLIERGFDPAQVLVLPNGVDVSRFTASRDKALRRGLCGDATVIGIFVGRLAPEKNHELLLRAWASTLANRPDAKLILVGDGILRQHLAELAVQLGIEGQVIFAGHNSNVEQYLAIADFGLLTSLAEGLSNSLLEYMAAGLPVVGSRISGTEDFVIPDETGWLFEPGDGDGLALALQSAVAAGPEKLRAMGDRARQLIHSTASLDAVTDQLMRCYGFKTKDQPCVE